MGQGYSRETEYKTPCSTTEEARPCAPSLTLPYSNGEANETLTERIQGTPVDVSVVADDGTFALDVGTVTQAAFGNTTGRFPSFDAIGFSALDQAAGHPIRRLRVMIHGTPGRMWFGDHSVSDLYGTAIATAFSPLKGHFSEDGFIELHSCNLAQYAEDPSTDSLVSQIAQAAGVPVVASRTAQRAGLPGMDGSTVTWTPQQDGTTTQTEQPHPIDDLLMAGTEALHDWIYGVEE